jgi:hypothetical protein
MSANSLFDPVIDGGVRNPNWFEGRLLTAQSMRERDLAERQRDQLLGRAIGSGVIEGLWVTRGAARSDGTVRTLSISKGSAITPSGDALVLGRDITVDVVPPAANNPTGPALFAPCQDPPAIATMPSGFGIYVLVMSSATGYRERAPKSGLGTEGVVTGCGDAFAVEGAQFRLEKLEPHNISIIDDAGRSELTTLIANSANPASRSLLRSIVAHHCFGTPDLANFAVDPFATSAGVSDFLELGALDDLRRLKRITCCDVPIAVLLWNINGVDYLDHWSVRRTPLPVAMSTQLPIPASARTRIEGVARFLQFQEHLAAVVADSTIPTSIRADGWFRYLPAAGLLPLTGTNKGVQLATFLQGIPLHLPQPPEYSSIDGPVFLEGARLPPLLETSFVYPPVELTITQSERSALWVLQYWMHRLSHKIPLLWAVHSFHHSAERLTAATGARHHWTEAILLAPLVLLTVTLFQVPEHIFAMSVLLSKVQDALQHVNYKIAWHRVGIWFNTPWWHRIHHSVDPKHYNKNFSVGFPIVDVIFGTAYYPAPDEYPETGLDPRENPRLWEGIIWPFPRWLGRRRDAQVA